MSGLDPIGRAEVRDLILDLKKRGKTVFFSTHIIPDVEMICDRIGLINHGRMVAEGSVSQLLDSSEARPTEVVVENVTGAFDGALASEVSSSGGPAPLPRPLGRGACPLRLRRPAATWPVGVRDSATRGTGEPRGSSPGAGSAAA